MAEDVRVTNMADSGSKERVAFDLMQQVQYRAGQNAVKTEAAILGLYYRCLRVTTGHEPKAD